MQKNAIRPPPVHPRRRGEHDNNFIGVYIYIGSSPQARGTHDHASALCAHLRFIPAGAGNTHSFWAAAENRAVHPRRRGEHTPPPNVDADNIGSSPQARGTRPRGPTNTVHSRFIPAGAGNTLTFCRHSLKRPVHPRRRGEHSAIAQAIDRVFGSSPQARGTPIFPRETPSSDTVHPRRRGEHPTARVALFTVAGSSPQARGTQPGRLFLRPQDRFIPAGAGNTCRACARGAMIPVHPRRRGEH